MQWKSKCTLLKQAPIFWTRCKTCNIVARTLHVALKNRLAHNTTLNLYSNTEKRYANEAREGDFSVFLSRSEKFKATWKFQIRTNWGTFYSTIAMLIMVTTIREGVFLYISSPQWNFKFAPIKAFLSHFDSTVTMLTMFLLLSNVHNFESEPHSVIFLLKKYNSKTGR